MLELDADHVARLFDNLVTRLVAEPVVHLFQVVHVAYRHGEFRRLAVFQLLVQFLFILLICPAVLHAGQRVAVGLHPGLAQRLMRLLVPFLHQQEIAQRNPDRQAEHQHGHQAAHVVGAVHPSDRAVQVRLAAHRVIRSRSLPDYIPVDHIHRFVRRAAAGFRHPDQRYDQHQAQQRRPYHHALSVPPFLVLTQHPVERDKPEDRPGDKQHIAFHGHLPFPDDVRHQQQHAADHHQRKAQRAAHRILLRAVFPSGLHRRQGHIPVNNRRPDGRHVHNPPDGRPAQERNQHRYGADQHDRPPRDMEPVQLPEFFRDRPVPPGGKQQPAQRHGVPDEARYNQGQQRHRQQEYAGIAHVIPGRVECRQRFQPAQVPQVRDVFRPGIVLQRIRGNRQQEHASVQHRRHNDHSGQDAEALLRIELKLFRTVRDILKSDKRPWRNRRDVQDLVQRRGILQHSRCERMSAAPVLHHRRDEHHHNRGGKQQRQHNHCPDQPYPAPAADEAEHAYRGNRQQRLAQVYVIAENRVQVSEPQHIPEEVPRKQRQARQVRPENSDIGQGQEPHRQEPVVMPQVFPCVRIQPAGSRLLLHQEMVVHADDQHEHRADAQAQYTAHRPCNRQVIVCSHDKRTPPDTAPDAQGPCANGWNVRDQCCTAETGISYRHGYSPRSLHL